MATRDRRATRTAHTPATRPAARAAAPAPKPSAKPLARSAAPAPKSSAGPKRKPVSPAERAAPKRKLPAALAERASALHAAAHARLVEQGREAIALIRERRADIAENYFDVGRALVTLKSDAMAIALGYADVPTLLREELELSVTTADKLIDLATRVDRSVLRELQQERAAAILALVDATPEDDTVEQLLARPFRVPGGAALDLRTVPVAAIRSAARAVRQLNVAPDKRARGFTTSSTDRAAFAKLIAPVAKDRTLRAAASFKLLASRAADGPIVELRAPLARFRDVIARLK